MLSLIAWSSGKDSAWALHVARAAGVKVVGALTTITDEFARVSMHAVREELLDAQVAAAGLESWKVRIPWPCPNEAYEARMADAIARARSAGITHIIFGDLFLEDIRAYRVKQLAGTGIEPLFPVWGRDTRELAREMIANGVRAHLTCVDPRVMPRELAGLRLDEVIDRLPEGVDPCGENGEFHTFVSAGPMLSHEVAVTRGDVVERDGFVFADLVCAPCDG
ncbi:MAG TPA: hypothetical protein VL463_25970 [Kofleriaceae bacterium]|jgi:uncharacterized protein (TIGR00290 family)|nr:hypothetical protein [Kofleriaceae bacterium]